MITLRIFLLLLWLILAGYTAIVISNHGLGLVAIFFGDMGAMTWSGQFNLDFMMLLALSGLWVAWRHHFSAPGIVLGLLVLFGGSQFLTAYLFVVAGQCGGDAKVLLLGKARASG